MPKQRIYKPRQILALTFYLDTKSQTFGNGYKSALKAGFSPAYARVLACPGSKKAWFQDARRKDAERLKKAEKNLDEFLETDCSKTLLTAEGSLVKVHDTQREKIKADMTKFTLERLNKPKYAARQEVTDAEGKPLAIKLDV